MDDTFIFDGLPPLCENEDQIKEFLSIGQP